MAIHRKTAADVTRNLFSNGTQGNGKQASIRKQSPTKPHVNSKRGNLRNSNKSCGSGSQGNGTREEHERASTSRTTDARSEVVAHSNSSSSTSGSHNEKDRTDIVNPPHEREKRGPQPSMDIGTSGDNPVQSQRPKRNIQHLSRNDIVNLDRLTSAEFLAELGETSHPSTISSTKALVIQKQKEKALRFKTLTNLSKNIMLTDSVTVDQNPDDTIEIETEKNKESRGTTSEVDQNPDDTMEFLTEKNQESRTKTNEIQESRSTNENRVIEEDISQDKDLRERERETNDTVVISSATDTIGTQTSKTLCLCTCQPCQGVLADFSMMLKTGCSRHCSFKPSQEEQQSIMSIGSESEEFIPLYKGSKLKITVTAKAKLKAITSQNPKDYVTIIMESLYSPLQMSNMSAEGRTKGSIKMETYVKDALFVYLSNKFENFETKELTEIINNKCYAERRKLWNKGDTDEVRKPLAKKGPGKEGAPKEKPLKPKVKRKNGKGEKSSYIEQIKKKLSKSKSKNKSKTSKELKKRKRDSWEPENRNKKRRLDLSERASVGQKKQRNIELQHPKTGHPKTGGKCPKSDKEFLRMSKSSPKSTFESSTPLPKKKKSTDFLDALEESDSDNGSKGTEDEEEDDEEDEDEEEEEEELESEIYSD